jgi:hypothetical protein
MGYVGGHAPDFFAWHKWKLGWLDAAQVACNNTAGEADFTLAPVETAGGTKMVVMRTSSTVAYVAENRQALAVDEGTCDTGIAIYKVDASKDTGYGPIQLVDAHPNDPTTAVCPHPLDDALFGFGAGEVDSFTTPDGTVTIQVTANTGDDYTIHVTRTTSFAPPPIVHDRTLLVTSLHYDGSTLTAKMRVSVQDGYAKCSHSVPILIQKKNAGRWRTVKTAKTTSTGTFTHRSTSGTYRAKLPKITFGSNPTNVCPEDASGEWPFF